jgi:hypothetical protein
VRVLNIDVGPDLLDRWRGWFAPDPQPFLVDAVLAETLGVERSAGPSQGWMNPRKVLRVDEVKRRARSRGRRLHRYRLTR